MSSPLKQLGQAAGGAAYAALYTVPADTIGWMKELIICNTTAGEVAAYVSVVPSGGAAGTANAIVYGFPVAANGFLPIAGLNTLMATGATIQVRGTGLTFTASGLEVAA